MAYFKKSAYPSVTEALSPYTGFAHVNEYVLLAASDRGVAVHAHCAAYAKGVFAPSPEKDLEGYVASFKWWFDAYVDDVLLVEEEMEDHGLQYCGHPDLIVRSSALGGVVLPDLKTPATLNKKLWGAQLSAYDNLARVVKIIPDRIGSLRLKKDGSPPIFDDFTEARVSYFAAFIGALTAYKFFK